MNGQTTGFRRLFSLGCLLALFQPGVVRGDGSINFNGGASEPQTSRLQNTTADVLNSNKQVTVSFWINHESRGESNLGYVFVLDDDDGDAAFVVSHYNFADNT